MLAVLLIVTVIFAIIDGAGTAVRRSSRSGETRNIQSIVQQAALTYREAGNPWPAGDGKEDSSIALLEAISSNKKSKTILERLPKTAIADTGSGRVLIDGFGTALRYDRQGGAVGSVPVITSLGPDIDDETDDITLELETTRTPR